MKIKLLAYAIPTFIVLCLCGYKIHTIVNSTAIHTHYDYAETLMMSGSFLIVLYGCLYGTFRKINAIRKIWRYAISFHLVIAFLSTVLFMILEPMKRLGIVEGLWRSPGIILITLPMIFMYTMIIFACVGVVGIPALYWVIRRLQTNSKL